MRNRDQAIRPAPVVAFYKGLIGTDNPVKATADNFDITQAQVRRIINEAIAKAPGGALLRTREARAIEQREVRGEIRERHSHKLPMLARFSITVHGDFHAAFANEGDARAYTRALSSLRGNKLVELIDARTGQLLCRSIGGEDAVALHDHMQRGQERAKAEGRPVRK